MDPLAALGSYGSDDSGDSDEEEAAPAPPPAPAAAPAAPLAPPALPDADSLLSDMPTWEPAAAPAAPRLDPKGTKYNAVPLPDTLKQAAAAASSSRPPPRAPAARQLRQTEGGARDVPAAGSDADKKRLLPPQLRRPNISTEDNAAMRLTQNAPKRPKPDA